MGSGLSAQWCLELLCPLPVSQAPLLSRPGVLCSSPTLSLQPPFTPSTPTQTWPLLLPASQTPLYSPPPRGPGLLL